MSAEQVTPLPWEVRPGVYETNPEFACEFPHGPEIVAANGECVTSLPMNAEEQAEQIITCCNSYPAMKAALERIEILTIARDTEAEKVIYDIARTALGLGNRK